MTENQITPFVQIEKAPLYDEDFLKKVILLGTLNYSLQKIMNVLDIVNEVAFTEDFNNPESIIYKCYTKGKDKGEFELDMTLYELAKGGDLDAFKKFELRKIRNSAE